MIKFGCDNSEEFQSTTGLKISDISSPLLFNSILEVAVRDVLDKYLRTNYSQIFHFYFFIYFAYDNRSILKYSIVSVYSDDVIKLSESKYDVRRATWLLIRSVKILGLKINENKNI